MGGKRWTRREDAILRRHMSEHGPAWPGWRKLLPGRTTGAISMRKAELGAAGPRSGAREPKGRSTARARRRWTKGQRARLLELALEMRRETGHSVEECAEELSRLARRERRGSRRKDAGT
ncbi:MAG: hypothetical protein J6D54_01785 [Olsenella sp.]|nr:hypothetical protein [Olsenella sp.]